MLNPLHRTPAYAFALARQHAGESIDPEEFARDYANAKAVWKRVHPEDKYYTPSEFHALQDASVVA